MTTPVSTPPEAPNPYAYAAPGKGEQWGIERNIRLGLTLATVLLSFSYRNGRPPLLGDIDLAVHEFGHVLFQPFGIALLGEKMVILGGSLFQIAFPLLFAAYFWFSKAHQDRHAASLCLWWAAMNVIDVSIYVADARARQLTLLSGVTGMEDDSHDFFNLFSQLGVLGRDTLYAGRLRGMAFLMTIASFAGGVWYALKKPPVRSA